ncbi:MAG TPA: hypothetical protein VNY05_37845 [Candidatus Acidoferrales bacterium]|nr:hypothetical protein [Candidatus Acidoferrales bacterium]
MPVSTTTRRLSTGCRFAIVLPGASARIYNDVGISFPDLAERAHNSRRVTANDGAAILTITDGSTKNRADVLVSGIGMSDDASRGGLSRL